MFTFRTAAAAGGCLVYVMISNMANKKTIQISFQDAYQVFKNQDLGQKRMIDRGESDKEIVEDILLHYGVELINPNDENLEEEKQVTFITIANFWYFHGFGSLVPTTS